MFSLCKSKGPNDTIGSIAAAMLVLRKQAVSLTVTFNWSACFRGWSCCRRDTALASIGSSKYIYYIVFLTRWSILLGCEDWSSERVLGGEKTYLSPAHVFFHGDDWNSMHLNFTSNGRDSRQWKTWPTNCLRNSNVMSAKITSFDMVNVAPCTALQRKPCISRLEFYIQHIGAKTSRFVLQRVVGVCVCARYQPHSCFCMTASWVGSPWTKGMGWFLCMDLPSCLEDLQ